VLPVTPPEHQTHLSTIVVIPARYESTRFPGKPLALIAGRPMIEHVYRRAAAARGVSRVIVATDDARIAGAVAAFGGEAMMTSPAHATGTDRLAEVAPSLDCDIVVNVQGDEPLVAPEMIEQAVAPFRSNADLLMSSLRSAITHPDDLHDPNVVKVVVDVDDFALYFSRAAIPSDRDGRLPAGREPMAWRHIGLYAYRRTFLPRFAALSPTPLERRERLEQLRALEHGIRIKVPATAHEALGVDTPDDLARVEALVASGGPGVRLPFPSTG
jgi:3-deoxy-manno-octulosonate cytidylyltransferase (CMP-KDO synthetase)